RNLLIAAGGNQNFAERLQVGTEVALVADVDGVTLAAFDGGADVLSAYRSGKRILGVFDREAVAAQRLPVPGHIQKVTISRALGEDVTRTRHFRKHSLNLPADLLDTVQITTLDLEADGGANAGREHLNTAADRHGPGIREAGDLQSPVHLRHKLGF